VELGNKRVYFVTGKGGTGKTAICVGLARALARRGKRVLLLEVDAPRPNLPSYFGGQSTYDPRVLAPRIEGCNIDFFSALGSYVRSVVPMKRVVGLVLRNRVVKVFLTATPGARELVLLSRIWEHSFDPRWDHILVDLPASGHAIALFRCPLLANRAFDRGPLRRRADEIVDRFSDPEVASLLFAALPGEMPINETIETRAVIEEMGLPPVGGVLLNCYPNESFTELDEQLLDQLIASAQDEAAPEVAQHAAESSYIVRREQHLGTEGLSRLREVFGEATMSLPILPGSHDQVAEGLSLVFGGAFGS
jgi:anion-transporting  ArsA/GET3 family ATPase